MHPRETPMETTPIDIELLSPVTPTVIPPGDIDRLSPCIHDSYSLSRTKMSLTTNNTNPNKK